MHTPNTSKANPEELYPEWHEPFPEPQTIPTGWDVSEIVTDSIPAEMDSAISAED
jgi:hypothetical protein